MFFRYEFFYLALCFTALFSFFINPKYPSLLTKAIPSAQARTCNCINKSKYLLNNKCLSNNILYKANITSTSENYKNKIYYGISETKFKSRYANHRKSFENRNYKTDIELSNEIWKLKEQKKCWHIVENSRDTSFVQHINKTMHIMSKWKISNSTPQRR